MATMAQRDYQDYLDALAQYQRGVRNNMNSLVMRNGQELVTKAGGGIYAIDPDTGRLTHVTGAYRYDGDYRTAAGDRIEGSDYWRLRNVGTRTPAQTVTGVIWRPEGYEGTGMTQKYYNAGYYDAAGNHYGPKYAALKEYTVTEGGQPVTKYDIGAFNYPAFPMAPKQLTLTPGQERQVANGTDAQRQLAEMRGGLIEDVIRGGGPK